MSLFSTFEDKVQIVRKSTGEESVPISILCSNVNQTYRSKNVKYATVAGSCHAFALRIYTFEIAKREEVNQE